MQTNDKHIIDDILFKYFKNQLNETEEKILLEWLNADTSHKKILYEMADWWATAHIPLFASDLKNDFNKYLKDLINKTNPVQQHDHIHTTIKWWSKIAASVLILLTTGILAFYAGRSTDKKEPQIAYYETSVPLGAQSKVVLPDQSVVWINAGSSIKYHEDTEKQTRNINLEGEAYFEVSKNQDMPFIVESGSLQVSVLGTSFNVKAYENQETIDIVLVSGKVEVRSENKQDDAYLLSPDEMLSYNKQTNHAEKSMVQSLNYCAWKNGQLKFDEQQFALLAKDLERIYNVQIEVKSDLLKTERFSGSFSYDYSINDILREIDVEKKYTWKQNGNQIIIRDK
ncbi:MAG: FecR family protein [Tannerella sp.]|jgi:ferric-dicitrate binding protein FerR (iron transport regulator)|nr:FecR family protein [Tannerella sp.]